MPEVLIEPDLLQTAKDIQDFGAAGITVHPRLRRTPHQIPRRQRSQKGGDYRIILKETP